MPTASKASDPIGPNTSDIARGIAAMNRSAPTGDLHLIVISFESS